MQPRLLRARERFAANVPRELYELARGQGFAKKERGRFRKLVRFVEDHCIAGRQQFRHALVLEHHIGEEQMMVDDDEVRGERLAPCNHHEAVAKARA